VGIGLAVVAIASQHASEALATLAAFMLGGAFGFVAYIGREFLITRNVIRALSEEIDNAYSQCKRHLEISDYEKAKERIRTDNTYIPYIPWQPIPHHLYRKGIEELFLVTEDLIRTVQKTYDSEVTIEIMVSKLEGHIFKEMDNERRANFLGGIHDVIVEDADNLLEAKN
jgi:hypothetical protein